jgi:hypothetical protein
MWTINCTRILQPSQSSQAGPTTLARALQSSCRSLASSIARCPSHIAKCVPFKTGSLASLSGRPCVRAQCGSQAHQLGPEQCPANDTKTDIDIKLRQAHYTARIRSFLAGKCLVDGIILDLSCCALRGTATLNYHIGHGKSISQSFPQALITILCHSPEWMVVRTIDFLPFVVVPRCAVLWPFRLVLACVFSSLQTNHWSCAFTAQLTLHCHPAIQYLFFHSARPRS